MKQIHRHWSSFNTSLTIGGRQFDGFPGRLPRRLAVRRPLSSGRRTPARSATIVRNHATSHYSANSDEENVRINHKGMVVRGSMCFMSGSLSWEGNFLVFDMVMHGCVSVCF